MNRTLTIGVNHYAEAEMYLMAEGRRRKLLETFSRKRFKLGKICLFIAGLFPVVVAICEIIQFGPKVVAYYGMLLKDFPDIPVASVAEQGRAIFMANFCALSGNLFGNGAALCCFALFAFKPGARAVWWITAFILTFVGVVDLFAVKLLIAQVGLRIGFPECPLVIGWIGLLLVRKVVFGAELAGNPPSPSVAIEAEVTSS